MGFFDRFKPYWKCGYDDEHNYYMCYEGWRVLNYSTRCEKRD